MSGMRIGQGVDAHQLVEGRPLLLAGIEVPHDRGLEGHSDGDVVLHAIASAVLGALGQGDLGTHFPSSDPALEGISSAKILDKVNSMMREAGYRLGNLDATIIAQEPRLARFLGDMRSNVASLLAVDESRVNMKCTSTDHLGFIGRGEGLAACVVVLLEVDEKAAK